VTDPVCRDPRDTGARAPTKMSRRVTPLLRRSPRLRHIVTNSAQRRIGDVAGERGATAARRELEAGAAGDAAGEHGEKLQQNDFAGVFVGGGGNTTRPSERADAAPRLLKRDLPALCSRLVADEIASGELVPEQTSPLGSRRHCAAVKRRMSAGEHGACIVGNVFLLSRAALAEELATLPPRMSRKKLDALQREIVGGLQRLAEVR
jgi:hypothetical protein